MSDVSESLPIVEKLLEKTADQKLEWETRGRTTFSCSLREGPVSSFTFFIDQDDDEILLTMKDSNGYSILETHSYSLPTNEEQDRLTDILREIYQLARRQALKIDTKLKAAQDLLDQT